MAEERGKNLDREIKLIPEQNYLAIKASYKKGEKVLGSITLYFTIDDLIQSDDENAHNIITALFSRGEEAMWRELEQYATSPT